MKNILDFPHATYPGVPVNLETIDARLIIVELEIRRLNRRWAPGDQRELNAALASLGEAVAAEERGKREG